MSKFRLTKRAQTDFDEIGRYTQREWGETQRTRYLTALDATFARLASNPRLGPARSDVRRDARGFVHGQHVIFYRVVRGGVVILRVLHAARDARRAF